jgi:spermidine/putrescine-binding protein
MILENLQTELISPIEKIKKFVSFYVNMLFQNKDFYQLVHFEMVNQKRACDFSAFSEIKKKNLKLLQNIIEEGQKDGEFKSNCNSLLIPALVIGTFSQIYNNKKFYIEMLNLNDDKAFENYMLNTFKEDITNVVLGMLIK